MAKQNESYTSVKMSDFENWLTQRTKHNAGQRKFDCLAFRASLNDVMHSHSVEKLNAFYRVLDKATAGHIKKAAFIFSGGYVDEIHGLKPARYYEPERSCLRWDNKNKLFTYEAKDKATTAKMLERYKLIAGQDYDCFTAKARPSDGLDAESIRQAATRLLANRDKWNPKKRDQIESILAALAGFFPEIRIDTEPTPLATTADFTGKPVVKTTA